MRKKIVILALILPMSILAVRIEPTAIIRPQSESPCSFNPQAVFAEVEGEDAPGVYLRCTIVYQSSVVYDHIVGPHDFPADELYDAVFPTANLEEDCYTIYFWAEDQYNDPLGDDMTREFCCVAVEEGSENRKVILDIKPLPSAVSVSYALKHGQTGFICLYDCTGNVVDRIVVDGKGIRKLGNNLSRGVYFVLLEVEEEEFTRKVVLID